MWSSTANNRSVLCSTDNRAAMCDEDAETVDGRRECSRGGVGQGEPFSEEIGDEWADLDCGVAGITRWWDSSERVLSCCGVEKGDTDRCVC